jgi:hypothetical protein
VFSDPNICCISELSNNSVISDCKCLTDIDEVQDQESNIGVCLKNQAETTKSIGLVSAKPETEKPVSEADNIKDTDKNMYLQLYLPKREQLFSH